MNNPILDAALASLAAGISVIPINPKDKRPYAGLLPLDGVLTFDGHHLPVALTPISRL